MTNTTPSPCINICKLDETSSFCTGCLRTREEISVWSTATSAQKTQILQQVEIRHTLPEYSYSKQQP